MLKRRSHHRAFAALALLGALCLGSAFHYLHHVVDPKCDASGARGAQPCATCSALHSSAIATQHDVAALPAPTTTAAVYPLEAGRPAVPAIVGGIPRAPPVA